jgi:hypothetical protein
LQDLELTARNASEVEPAYRRALAAVQSRRGALSVQALPSPEALDMPPL